MSTTYRVTRGLLLVAMSAIMALVSVGTAAGDDPVTGVIVFQGSAYIGYPIESKTEDCVKDPDGGLNFPVVEDPENREPALGKSKTRCWGFESDVSCRGVTVVSAPDILLDEHCVIQVDGNLSGYCGMSSGAEGKGTLAFPLDPSVAFDDLQIYLNNVSWPVSAGGIVPVLGSWDDTSTKERKGVLVALLQASGSSNDGQNLFQACIAPNGATLFQVNGVAALQNTGGLLVLSGGDH